MEQQEDLVRQELETTRERLREAEATLRAIHRGTVDALVINGSEGEEIHGILKMGTLADSLFNLVGNPIFIVDSFNRILRINDAAQDLWGGNPELVSFNVAVPLQSMKETFPRGSGAMNGLPDGWVDSGQAITGVDMALVRPDGETRYYQLDAKPVVLPQEGFTGGLVSLTDITKRKRAEIQSTVRNEQLRYQLEMTKSITDNVEEGLILLDDQNRVVFQNPAAERLLKLPSGDLVGKVLYEAVTFEPDPDAPPHQAWSAPAQKAIPHMRNLRGILVDSAGNRVPVACSHSNVSQGFSGRGSVLVISDISSQVKAEKELLHSIEKQRQSQKMEAIGRLAGGIAHDFNNLLLAIMGFADLSLALVKEPAVRSNLREIKSAGEKAANLTSQLLAYSRKQVLAPKVRSINEVVDEARKMLARLIGENISMAVDLGEEPILARIDAAKIQQVLVNIVLNARDAMPEGGTLSIRTGKVSLTDRDLAGMLGSQRRSGGEDLAPGEYGAIEVADTGHGMGKEVIDRLFEPFFTTKEFGKGSGLGLSTAFGIVRQMGGFIQVSSEVGKGAVFTVLLPLSEERGPKVREDKAGGLVRNEGAGRTVLLVEDEALARVFLKELLIRSGYRVVEAQNGAEALERLEGEGLRPDLIVTDVVMDKMGGLQLAARLRSTHPEAKVLFISGYPAEAHGFLAQPEADTPFMAKPFRPAEFLQKVKSLIQAREGSQQ